MARLSEFTGGESDFSLVVNLFVVGSGKSWFVVKVVVSFMLNVRAFYMQAIRRPRTSGCRKNFQEPKRDLVAMSYYPRGCFSIISVFLVGSYINGLVGRVDVVLCAYNSGACC